MIARPRLLIVEDDANKQWLLKHYVSKSIPNAECILCSNGAEAIEYLKMGGVDAIITDHYMQPVNGIELIKWVRQHSLQAPIVMITAHTSIEAEAMKAGANVVLSTHRFGEIGEILLPILANTPGS
jgi:DNA-binding NtrC family response regulator